MNKKTVIITGAGSGIGAECMSIFAHNKYKVIASDINLQSVSEEIIHKGLDEALIDVHQLDVTSYDAVNTLMQRVVDEYQKIDVLINNAGIMNSSRVPTHMHDLDDWHNVINVNQTGVFYCMKASLKHMKQQRSGSIVNIASLAGLKASGYNLAYSASKFAVVGMTKSAAIEYASKGIRINAICPSYTETPMLEKEIEKNPTLGESFLAFTPMNRFGTPQEIAEAVYWISSEKASYITGQTITLDGGLSL